MEKLSQHLQRLQTEKEKVRQANALARVPLLERLDSKEIPVFEGEASNTYSASVVQTVRSSLREGQGRLLGVLCDHCSEELVTFSEDEDEGEDEGSGGIFCSGCGFSSLIEGMDVQALFETPNHTLEDSKVKVLTQLVAMMLSNAPVVLERQRGRLVLELPSEAVPFEPFNYQHLHFTVNQEGNRVTLELQGELREKEDNLTLWEHLDEADPAEPEEPLCGVCHLQPIVLGSDRCAQCQNKEIFRHWLNR